MCTIVNIIFGTLIAFSLLGCATGQHTTMDINTTTPSIEFLSFDGCPNTPLLREYLEAALEQSNGSFATIDLTQLNDTDIRRGYGSPTILVSRHDLFDMPEPTSPNMSCRIYPGGLPNTQTIIAKLSEKIP